MSDDPAPLVTHCAQFTRALLRRMGRWPVEAMTLIGRPLLDAAFTLQSAVSDALLHREQRCAELLRADRALTRLRVMLAASEEVPGLFGAAQRLELGEALGTIGQMLGGWRRHATARSPPGAVTR